MSLYLDLKNRVAEFDAIEAQARHDRVLGLFDLAKKKITDQARDAADMGHCCLTVSVDSYTCLSPDVEELADMIINWLRTEGITAFSSGSSKIHFEFRWIA